ncbi:molybdenum cofactor guanylyltransferase [Corynebacterium sp. L4756]|uniref:molybdenum cofactor guanylyltransferase n=1 Tax=unclassified Corynebacterium TaxID=2624378 RepID=UPI00374D457B
MSDAAREKLATIIVAGGQGTRMGGVDKASVKVHGIRLVDRLIAQLPTDTDFIVVSPRELGVPTTSEEPPFGGPVAGIHAGYEYLIRRYSNIEYLAILPVDAPDSPQILPRLYQTMETEPGASVALIRSHDGSLQNLCALWRTDTLAKAFAALGSPRNQSVRRLLAHAENIVEVPGTGQEKDYDTRQEAEQYQSSAPAEFTRAQLD